MFNRGGLGKIHQQKQMQDAFAKTGQKIEEESLEQIKEQLKIFSSNLEKFGNQYKEDIKFNPDFREKFYSMCKEIGVDPLSTTSLWNKNLNLTEFYYNLAIQIITISLAFRDEKGALIEMNELRNILISHRKVNDISVTDIEKAIESVSELKCGFQIVNLKNSRAVMTIPMHLSNETNILIQIASECKGCLGYTYLYSKTNMSKTAFEAAVVKYLIKFIFYLEFFD
jgi:ESCRT-II complex subunit VPS22